MSKMKAIVQDRYGSVDQLRLAEVERPTPARDEVLVRVHAASVHADVWHVVVGLPHVLRLMGAGLRRPKNPIPSRSGLDERPSGPLAGDAVSTTEQCPGRGRGTRS